jgi:hypothetical protein
VIAIGRLLVGRKLALKWIEEEESRTENKMTFRESFYALQSLMGSDRDVERTELRVIVHENPYARMKWPQDLFRGPWDEHYGIGEEGYIRRVYAGQAVLEWEKLTGKVADFSK